MKAEIVQALQAKQKKNGATALLNSYTRAGVFVFISNANIQRGIAGRKSIIGCF